MLEIRRYYARVASPQIAERILRELDRVCVAIALRPLARRPRDELMPGLRSALVRPYSIFYRISGEDIEIVRILHERRNLATAFDNEPRN